MKKEKIYLVKVHTTTVDYFEVKASSKEEAKRKFPTEGSSHLITSYEVHDGVQKVYTQREFLRKKA